MPTSATPTTPFSAALSRLIEARGVKKGALASKLGVRPATVSSWCSGQHRPDVRHLAGIEAFMRLDQVEARMLRDAYVEVSTTH